MPRPRAPERALSPATVGGDLTAAFVLDLNHTDTLAGDPPSIRVRDLYDQYPEGTPVEIGGESTTPQDVTWYEYRTGSGDWVRSAGPTDYDPERTGWRRFLCVVGSWDSTESPLGNNWQHRVFTNETYEIVRHTEEDGVADSEPWSVKLAAPISYSAYNLWISGARGNPGNAKGDYFKWDPDADQIELLEPGDALLSAPTITFSIHDADPHKCEVVVWYRSTAGDGTWNRSAGFTRAVTKLAYGGSSSGIDVTVPMASPDSPGGLVPDQDRPGPYTFDIGVYEYLDGTQPPSQCDYASVIDSFTLKTPYCLWVSEHEVRVGGAGLLARYTLNDQNGTSAEDLKIETIGPLMEPLSTCDDGGTEAGVDHGGPPDSAGKWPGIPIHTIGADEIEIWRSLWTAEDPDGRTSLHRRNHQPMRMMVANNVTDDPWARYMHLYPGHASAAFTDPGLLPPDYDEGTALDPDGNQLPHGYYDAGAWQVGYWPDVQGGTNSLLGPGELRLYYLPAGLPPVGRDPLSTPEPRKELVRAYELRKYGFRGDGQAVPGREWCRQSLDRIWGTLMPPGQEELIQGLRGRSDVQIEGDHLNTGFNLAAFNCSSYAAMVIGDADGLPLFETPWALAATVENAHGVQGPISPDDHSFLGLSGVRYLQGRWYTDGDVRPHLADCLVCENQRDAFRNAGLGRPTDPPPDDGTGRGM